MALGFLHGGGEMGARMRAHDWSGSPLGQPEGWPGSLRAVVGLMLNSRFPMFVAWGPELGFLYNDAYIDILGSKHPRALGERFHDIWFEIWDDISPLIDQALAGEASYHEDLPLIMERKGFREQTWFTFSYSPVRDESGAVAGMFCACTETTQGRQDRIRLLDERARLEAMFEAAPSFIGLLEGPEHRFVLANAAYRRLVGGRDLVGLTVAEALPEVVEQGFIGLLDQVRTTGQAVIMSAAPVELNTGPGGLSETHYLDFVYQPLKDADGAITGVFVEGYDVTGLYATSEALKASQARQSVLLELNVRIAELNDPEEISFAAAEILARAMGVDRAGYGLIDPREETITIARDWNAPGVRSLAGVLNFRDYGSYIEDLKRGETVVFADAREDPRTRETAQALEAINARSIVNMPVTEEGAFVALLYLNHGERRDWTDEELGLIREVANVTRSAVERRRAESALLAEKRALEILNDAGAVVAADTDLDSVVQRITDAGVALTGAAFGAFFYNVLDDEGGSYMLYAISGVEREAFSRFPMPRNTEIFAPTFAGEGIVRSDDITQDPRYGRNAPHRGMPEGHLPVRSYLAVPVRSREGEVLGGLFFGHPEPSVFGEDAERGLAGLAGQAAVAIDNGRLFQSAQAEIRQRVRAEEDLQALNAGLEARVEAEVSRLREAEQALHQSQKMETVGQLTGGVAHDFNNLLTPIVGALDMLQRRPGNDARATRLIEGALTAADRAKTLVHRLLAFSRRQHLEPRAVDVGAVLETLRDLIARSLGPGIGLRVDVQPGLPPAQVDPNQLELALLNLAVNARDAMGEEGVLSITADEIGGGDTRCVRIAVTDTGAGMDAETLARAVEPFFTTKDVGRGTGLGLSSVKGLAEQSGGEFSLESEVGRGTTAILCLPTASGPVEDRAQAAEAPAVAGGQAVVLLVDDEAGVRMGAADMLTEAGYTVVEAASPQEALAEVESGLAFDLLITDYAMPGMSGARLAAALKARRPDLPVLLTTGYASMREGDVDGLPRLAKPFRQSELVAAVRAALRR